MDGAPSIFEGMTGDLPCFPGLFVPPRERNMQDQPLLLKVKRKGCQRTVLGGPLDVLTCFRNREGMLCSAVRPRGNDAPPWATWWSVTSMGSS